MEISESVTQTQASNRLDDPNEEMLEDIEVQELEKTTTTKTGKEQENSKKRKVKERSDVWLEFTKVLIEVGDPPIQSQKGKCNRCGRLIAADPKMNGTTAMWKHHASCLKNFEAKRSQTVLNQEGSGSLISWKFNQEGCRMALCRMIILDELPFRFVEREGFKQFMREAQPLFRIPGRQTIRADCVKLFMEQKTYMKSFFSLGGMGRVSLTTNSWTAINNTNFICVTAHCIDKEWQLHKKIIGFSKICSHKGEDLAAAVINVLEDWELQRIFSCTMDNASANDVAIRHMTSFLENKNMTVAGGKYLHLRCVAHIINLVVEEGLSEIGMSVRRVREAVKWIKASPSRYDSFKDTARLYKVDTSKCLCLDVPTRWNSSYLMLEAALPYESVMSGFERVSSEFVRDLRQKQYNNISIGVPQDIDWLEVKRMCNYLRWFYKLTLLVSGTKYVTSHTFFKEMCDIFRIISRMQSIEDDDVKRMATKMKTKLGKYWLEETDLNPRMNKIIYITALLDPRQKMKHVHFCLKTVYGDARANELMEELNKSIYELFELYQKEMTPTLDQTPTSTTPTTSMTNLSDDLGDLFEGSCSHLEVFDDDDEDTSDRSVITLYFTEKQYKMNANEIKNFDILQWWSKYSPRFPVLSEMARDIMAIPISSVASEAAFSTGGRVLSQFRSSLTPNMVEALICAEDWLRSSSSDIFLEDEEDVPETVLEKEYEAVLEELRKVGILGRRNIASTTATAPSTSSVQSRIHVS